MPIDFETIFNSNIGKIDRLIKSAKNPRSDKNTMRQVRSYAHCREFIFLESHKKLVLFFSCEKETTTIVIKDITMKKRPRWNFAIKRIFPFAILV
jgi:hypothetical protein